MRRSRFSFQQAFHMASTLCFCLLRGNRHARGSVIYAENVCLTKDPSVHIITVSEQLIHDNREGDIVININYRDPRPIYEQIMDSVRRLVFSGAMAPEEKLPSVRELASRLAINPNTIQRAYRELENEGYIYSVSGKGSFIARCDEIDDGRKNELLQQFDAAASELEFLGVTRQELCRRLTEGGQQDGRRY